MNFKDLLPIYQKESPRAYTYRFTVFTPVFNCEKSIEKAHNSLLNQTYNNFEWLIINDASTDKSHDVITRIIETSPLNIHYVNNETNKHKMSCFIQSIEMAQGEFLLTFDGDDECYPMALETFNTEYQEIPEEIKPKVAAVTALCIDQNGNQVGDSFPEDPFYCNTFVAGMMKQITGEKWGFTKTDVLKSITVDPKIFGRGYIPESIIWNTIARHGFLTKCVNKTLRIYNINVEGSISSTHISKTAFGAVLNGIAKQNWFFKKYFLKSPIFFLKTLFVSLRSSKYLDYPLKVYLRSFDSYLVKSMVFVLWPFRRFMK